MTDSQPEPFTSGLTILDGGKEYPLPDWASSLLWLGQWCRNHRDPLNRLVTFVVLPTRDFAAVFAGIGAIVGGAKLFEDKLSWPIFRELSVGTSVYWQKVGGGPKFAGTILGFSDMYGSEFISVEVTKPASSATPACISISKQNFETYAFRLERPPTSARFISLNNASQFIGGLCDGINPKWINADGAEGLIVTNMENFQ